MSWKMTDRIYNIELPTAPMKSVALKLAHHADENGEHAFPSARTIALGTGQGLSTVRDALAELEASGVIVEVKKGDGVEQRSTEYRFDLKVLAALPQLVRSRGQLRWDTNGKLRWSRVEVQVIDPKTGRPKIDSKTGFPKMRVAHRLTSSPAGNQLDPVQEPDPTPSRTGTGSTQGCHADPVQEPDAPRPAAGADPVQEPDPNHHQESKYKKEDSGNAENQFGLDHDEAESEGGPSMERDVRSNHQPKIVDAEWLPTAFPMVHTSQLISGVRQICLDCGTRATNDALQKLRKRVESTNLPRVLNPIPYLRKAAEEIASAGHRPSVKDTNVEPNRPTIRPTAQLLRSLEPPRRIIGGMR